MARRFLFLHGWATDPWVWEAVAARLKGRGIETLNVALPSHGAGALWDRPDLTPALEAIEQAVGAKPFIGVGWSLGATSLLAYAAKRPSMVEALVLVGATPRFTASNETAPEGQSRALVRRMMGDVKKDAVGALKRFYGLNFTEDESRSSAAGEFIKRYEYPGPVDCGPRPGRPPGCYPLFDYPGLATALEALDGADLCGSLTSIDVPALLIHGGRDAVVPAGAARYLKEHLKDARLDLFEGAGHAPFLTDAKRFNERLDEFLTRSTKG